LERITPSEPTLDHSARAAAVIQIFLPGGLAQQESFDPKPHAPAEYRGLLPAADFRANLAVSRGQASALTASTA
jgi:hypothetical protein